MYLIGRRKAVTTIFHKNAVDINCLWNRKKSIYLLLMWAMILTPLERKFREKNFREDHNKQNWFQFTEAKIDHCHSFLQIFRQINFWPKNFTVNWFDDKNFAWQWIFLFFSKRWKLSSKEKGSRLREIILTLSVILT